MYDSSDQINKSHNNSSSIVNLRELDISTSTSSLQTKRSDINILSNIIVQPAIKRKGRPRGADNTVIGLPRKRKQLKKELNMPFNKKSTTRKCEMTIKWLVTEKKCK